MKIGRGKQPGTVTVVDEQRGVGNVFVPTTSGLLVTTSIANNPGKPKIEVIDIKGQYGKEVLAVIEATKSRR